MAYIYRRTDSRGRKLWYLGFKDEGGRWKQKNLRTDSERKAKRALGRAEKHEEELRTRPHGEAPSNIYLADLVRDYLQWCRMTPKKNGRPRSPRTLEHYRYGLAQLPRILGRDFDPGPSHYGEDTEARLVEALGKRTVAHVSEQLVEQWCKDNATRAPRLVSSTVSALKRLFSWGEKRKRGGDPLARMEVPTTPRTKRRAFRPDEIKRLLKPSASPKHLALVWYLLSSRGLRSGELIGLNWQDFDATKGTLTIREETSKGEGRTVGVPEDLTRELLKWRMERRSRRQPAGAHDPLFIKARPRKPGNWRWRGDELLNRLKACIKRAKIDPRGLCVHSFRYSACTELLRAGVPPSIVMKILGHQSQDMTLRTYNKLTSAEHPAIQNLPFSYGRLTRAGTAAAKSKVG